MIIVAIGPALLASGLLMEYDFVDDIENSIVGIMKNMEGMTKENDFVSEVLNKVS